MRPRRDGRELNEIMSVAFVSVSPWASTDVPWGGPDDDGIEVPSDLTTSGACVPHCSLVIDLPANATLCDVKADEDEQDSGSDEEKD